MIVRNANLEAVHGPGIPVLPKSSRTIFGQGLGNSIHLRNGRTEDDVAVTRPARDRTLPRLMPVAEHIGGARQPETGGARYPKPPLHLS